MDSRRFLSDGLMSEYWLQIDNSEGVLPVYHREDGPAITWANGRKEWWVEGKRHRVHGPAYEYGDEKIWYLFGIQYTEEEHLIECLKRGLNKIILFED